MWWHSTAACRITRPITGRHFLRSINFLFKALRGGIPFPSSIAALDVEALVEQLALAWGENSNGIHLI